MPGCAANPRVCSRSRAALLQVILEMSVLPSWVMLPFASSIGRLICLVIAWWSRAACSRKHFSSLFIDRSTAEPGWGQPEKKCNLVLKGFVWLLCNQNLCCHLHGGIKPRVLNNRSWTGSRICLMYLLEVCPCLWSSAKQKGLRPDFRRSCLGRP